MKSVHYGDLKVDFTDGEYRRLQEIKQERYENPEWTPPEHLAKGANKVVTNIYLPHAVRDKAKIYAKSHGISFSQLIGDILTVITT